MAAFTKRRGRRERGRNVLRILEVRTKQLNVPVPIELGPGCRVRTIKLTGFVDGGVAKLQFEDGFMTILGGEQPLVGIEWGGLNDPLPPFTRVTNGVCRIMYDDGVTPK